MSNPWDRPPIPQTGDESEDTTYAGVGRVMSAWEDVEIATSFTYAQLSEKPESELAFREYGSGRIFADRMKILDFAAGQFFVRHNNQSLEGKYKRLGESLRGFASRRNDIAHGIVRKLLFQPAAFTVPKHVSLLLPPYYNPRQFDSDNKPAFAYSSVELLELAASLHDLHLAVHDFRFFVRKEIAMRRRQQNLR